VLWEKCASTCTYDRRNFRLAAVSLTVCKQARSPPRSLKAAARATNTAESRALPTARKDVSEERCGRSSLQVAQPCCGARSCVGGVAEKFPLELACIRRSNDPKKVRRGPRGDRGVRGSRFSMFQKVPVLARPCTPRRVPR